MGYRDGLRGEVGVAFALRLDYSLKLSAAAYVKEKGRPIQGSLSHVASMGELGINSKQLTSQFEFSRKQKPSLIGIKLNVAEPGQKDLIRRTYH